MTLDVGEDQLILNVRPSLYYMDVALDVPVVAEETGAQFDRQVEMNFSKH